MASRIAASHDTTQPGKSGALFMLVRPHILAIAGAATLAFGSLYLPKPPVAAALLIMLDWFVVNFLNRLSDVDEDLHNQIAGTAWIAKNKAVAVAVGVTVLASAFAIGHALMPRATPARIAFHAIGLAYNFRLVPTPHGLRRFKELKWLKNTASAVLFVLACIIVPVSARGPVPLAALWMAAFFLPLELTYELIFDVRDIDGDRRTGLTTIATDWGAFATYTLMRALIVISASVLVVGFLSHALRIRELVFAAGCIQQWLAVAYLQRRGATGPRVINVVFLGAAQLLSYVLWIAAGLPTFD